MQNYKILFGKHEGEIAFIVGAGTSLYGLDLAPIFEHVVISVNSGFLLMPWDKGQPDKRYWLSNDALVRRWSYWADVKQCKATKLVRNSWKEYYDEIPDFLIFWPRKTSEDIIYPEGDGLCYCSSVPTSIDLCIQMGIRQVYLLGVDHYTLGAKRYYWQFWPKKKQPKMFIDGMSIAEYMPNIRQQRWTYGFDKKAYKALQGFAEYKGVKIYNCNPASMVDAFEKISFDKMKNVNNAT